jgi:hypothetical protein
MPAVSTKFDTSGAFGAEVVIHGLDAVRNALEEIGPEVRRAFDRELRQAVTTVARTAATQIDSRTGATAAGYQVKRRGSAYRIANRTRGAAILEFAGKVNPQGTCPQGASLIRTLDEKYGRPGRVLWESWDTMQPWVIDRVRQIVDDAELTIESAGV